jgi:multidrug efflux pump subunit AcrB
MRSGEKIGDFGEAVDATLADLKTRLPEDLVMARTSDQPLQVEENVELFMSSLYEAIILVVIVSLIGFWEWRSALLMAISIPITLAMTFGMMSLCGIDVQQVSIATLIIALGLLVDDPVVAGDAIKRDLALGHPPIVAAWLGFYMRPSPISLPIFRSCCSAGVPESSSIACPSSSPARLWPPGSFR